MRRLRVMAALLGLATGLAIIAILVSSGFLGKGGSILDGLRPSAGSAAATLVFLREVDGVANLWSAGDDGVLVRLSSEPFGVWDYSPVPGGGVLLSAFTDGGSLDLVWLSPQGERAILVDCGPDSCRDARWQPEGELVAFERLAASSDSGATEIWLFDSVSGESWPVDDGSLLEQAGFRPFGRHLRWSADGRFLSYYHPEARAIVVLDVDTNETMMIPSNLEAMGDWSRSGHTLAYSELTFGAIDPHDHEEEPDAGVSHEEPSLYNHLVVTDIGRGASIDLSEGLEVNDGVPAWRPHSDALAVGRSFGGSGRQIWLVEREGASQPLTADKLANHTAPAWSPDGRTLAYMRSEIAVGTDSAAVWLLDVESGESRLAAEDAFLPGWLLR